MNVLEMQSIQAALKKAAPIQNNVPSMRATTDNTPLISPISNRFSPIQAIKAALEMGARKDYLTKGILPAGQTYTAPPTQSTTSYTAPATTSQVPSGWVGPGGTYSQTMPTASKYAPMPVGSNPWAGKSIEQIRSQEYARSPGMQPLEAAVGATNGVTNGATESTLPPNVMTYLKDYVQQMRSAGYSDMAIKQNLLKTGSIQIPNQLPENFGQNKWATGMNAEFGRTNLVPQTLEGNMPSVNEYQNYQPGNMANRLPSYSEATGQDSNPQLFNQAGQFSQNKRSGLMSSLQNYMNNYQGKTVPFSENMAKAGMVGLPQDLANSWIPEYTGIQNQASAEADRTTKYQDLALKYPTAGITPADTFETSIAKINDSIGVKEAYPDAIRQQNIQELSMDALNGYTLNELIMDALIRNLKLTDAELQAIYDTAQAEMASQSGAK